MAGTVVVVGGANMDVRARSRSAIWPATSNPGTTTTTAGGVARNVAENLARLGTRAVLVARVGDDVLGDSLLATTRAAGVDVRFVHRTAPATGTYTAVLDAGGELVVAVADMAATDELPPSVVEEAAEEISGADLVFVDANLSAPTLARTFDLARQAGVRVVLDPVSVPKAVAAADQVGDLFLLSTNAAELVALTGLPTGTDAEVSTAARMLHQRGVELVWVRRGPAGSLLSGPGGIQVVAPVAVPPADVVDVTGAGDAMLAAFCHDLLRGAPPEKAVRFGQAAAARTVTTAYTVNPELSEASVRMLL